MDFVNRRRSDPASILLIVATCALLAVALPVRSSGTAAAQAAASPASAPTSKKQANSVVAWLTGAEIQAETDAQRAELRRGLQDMLKLPPDKLRQRRYAAADGTPAARSLPELLTGHLVPRTPQALDERRIYDDTRSPAAQRAVRRVLSQLKR